jgi:hypothetical protein
MPGQDLDPISPKLLVQGRYSYAFVEKVIDISTNRSTGSLEVDYQLTRKLLARGILSLQRTHGGLRFGSPPPATLVIPGEVNTPETLYQHDRLLRDNNWRAGAGLAYSYPKFDVFASYIEYMGGTDTHAGRAVTFGLAWPFELGRHGSR